MPSDHFPVLLALVVVFAFGGGMLWMSARMGPRSRGRVNLSPYESGSPLLDTTRKRVSILFFLVAIDFVVFDVEAAFLYLWALVVREGGWPLFWAMLVFVFFVVVGLAYIWRKGGLDLRR